MIKRMILSLLVLLLFVPATFAADQDKSDSAAQRLKAWESYRRDCRREQINNERLLLETWAEAQRDLLAIQQQSLVAVKSQQSSANNGDCPMRQGPGPGAERNVDDGLDDCVKRQLN